jgi:hypothetical protein
LLSSAASPRGGRTFSSKTAMEEFEAIRERLQEVNENAVLCDGLEDALVGIANRFGMEPVACYDRLKIIDIYVKRDGMTHEEADEFFEFNVIGAYVDHCPVFVEIERDAFLIS